MKKFLLPLFAVSLLFTNCKKNKDNDQPAEFIQLQKMESTSEFGTETTTFAYNDQHQPTRIEMTSKVGTTSKVSGYVNFSYENGAPTKAELFITRSEVLFRSAA